MQERAWEPGVLPPRMALVRGHEGGEAKGLTSSAVPYTT